jgi:hypothetical protein
VWIFPLRVKYDIFHFVKKIAYAFTQFDCTIKAIQCDNGHEFNHASTREFFATKGVLLWMSCPYTSSQNGKAERILRTINNMLCSRLFSGFYSGSLLGRRASHHHISTEPPPHQGDQHDQPILHPPWSRPPAMSTCACSIVPPILISPSKTSTNWHLGPLDIFS